MNFSPNQLIDIQISALFVSDAQQRLCYIREPGYPESELDPAPRFFMGRTLHGNIWRFRYDLPDEVVTALEHICRKEPTALNLKDIPNEVVAIHTVLNEHSPISQEEQGPAYWIPNQTYTSSNTVLISEENAYLLEAHFPWKITSPNNFRTGPLVATVVSNTAVAICFCARITSLAAEAGVETVEAFRRQGYASAAVAGWSIAVRQCGLIPLYTLNKVLALPRH
jgi:hypothetical protein